MSSRFVSVDLITHRPTDDAFILVAVEEGPWEDAEIESNVRRLERRLSEFVQCVVYGGFAETFPESYGKPIVIRLDGYGVADSAVRQMFDRFQQCILESAPVQQSLESGLMKRLAFEYNWRQLPG